MGYQPTNFGHELTITGSFSTSGIWITKTTFSASEFLKPPHNWSLRVPMFRYTSNCWELFGCLLTTYGLKLPDDLVIPYPPFQMFHSERPEQHLGASERRSGHAFASHMELKRPGPAGPMDVGSWPLLWYSLCGQWDQWVGLKTSWNTNALPCVHSRPEGEDPKNGFLLHCVIWLVAHLELHLACAQTFEAKQHATNRLCFLLLASSHSPT